MSLVQCVVLLSFLSSPSLLVYIDFTILANKIIHFRIQRAPSEVAAPGVRLADPAVVAAFHRFRLQQIS